MREARAENESDSDSESKRRIQKQKRLKESLVGSIRYGISEIDTNLELKKFIIDQNEKKLKVKNRLLFDVKNFMQDLVKIKEGSGSTSSIPETKRPKSRPTLMNKFTRRDTTQQNAVTKMESSFDSKPT